MCYRWWIHTIFSDSVLEKWGPLWVRQNVYLNYFKYEGFGGNNQFRIPSYNLPPLASITKELAVETELESGEFI